MSEQATELRELGFFYDDIQCPKCGAIYEDDLVEMTGCNFDDDEGEFECECGHTVKVVMRVTCEFEVQS